MIEQKTTQEHKPNDSILALNTPKKPLKLETTSYDYAVDGVINLIEDGQIDLPILPSNALWNVEKASVLIESLLMNFPIPPLYCSENEHGKWSIIDGIQRLSALFNFYQNTHPLKGLTILSEFEGKKFNELPPQAKRLIHYSIIRIILIKNNHPDILHNVMMRLSTQK
jgi:hypothetical protein